MCGYDKLQQSLVKELIGYLVRREKNVCADEQ